MNINTIDTVKVKFYSEFQYRPMNSVKRLLQSMLRRGMEFSKKYVLRDGCMSDDVSFNYFEYQMWKESGQSQNNMSSTVLPRIWRRHSALLSLWKEQAH
jgi:hypothetical protein